MTNALPYKHRQPGSDWTKSNNSIVDCFQYPIASAVTIAQEVFDEVTNLSIAYPPREDTVATLIYESKIVRDYLLDVAEMLEELERR